MTVTRPLGMPSTLDRCWGKLIQDGDRECDQCRWNDSCRSRFMEVAAATPPRPPPQPLPIYGAYQPTTPPPAPAGMVPMPPPRPSAPLPTYAPPSQATAQVRHPTTPSATTPPAQPYHQPQPQYAYQQTHGYSIPDPNRPNPMNPMFRPGSSGAPYYFNQYPGESVGVRLTKNMFLRALEALFGELKSFFGNWTMPPKQ